MKGTARTKLTRKDYENLIITEKGLKKKKTVKGKKKAHCAPMRGGGGGGVKRKDPFLKNIHLFGMISNKNANAKQRQALVESMNNSQLGAIKNVTKKFLASDYVVPAPVLKRLVKDRDLLYELIGKKTPVTRQKSILNQTGGFIHALLPLALKAAAPLLGNLLSL